jgi:methyl-accepting chemotaxis protein
MSSPEKRFAVRKNYFIKKSFQIKFIIAFVLLLLVEAAAIVGLFMFMSRETLTTGYSGAHFVIEKTSSFFAISFIIIILVVGTAMALAGVILFMLLSHQIAGPLYRVEKTLEGVSRGNLARRIKLRKTDQLKKLQGTFNMALDKMESQIKEIEVDLKEARRLASRTGEAKQIQKLEKQISQIERKLSFFRTS